MLIKVTYEDLKLGQIFYMSPKKLVPQYKAFRFDGEEPKENKPYNIKVVEIDTNEISYVEKKWFKVRDICQEVYE